MPTDITGTGDAANGFAEPAAEHGGWSYDVASRAITWSEGVYRIHGVTPATFVPSVESVAKLVHPEDLAAYRRAFRSAAESRSPFLVQHRIIRPDGAVRTVVVRGAHLIPEDGGPGSFIGTTQDVTGRAGHEEHLWHMANRDGLTGLFNRRRFMEELGREIAVARRSGEEGAVLMVDLDGFKDINDSLGHGAGDDLLTRVARYLRGRLRETDTLARIGGDEFAVVLPSCPRENARRVAEELVEALAAGPTVKIAGHRRAVDASVGVAPFGSGQRTQTAEQVLVEADLAMYRVKRSGGNGVEVFDEEMRAELAARVRIENELREALDRDELEVFYQPIVSLHDGTTVGCEALVRWRHPRRGLVGPDEFIPVAEEYGLVGPIGERVLEKACRQAREWRNRYDNVFVSVNVSPLQLVRDDVVETIARTLHASQLPPPLLYVEITETSLIRDARTIAPALEALKDLGIRVAIDDFGGGTSSLSFLSLLPIDVIKVDRLFINGLPHRADDRAIVTAVISLAEELELSVIAEGVETERQHWELRELGCPLAQGFLYARPRPPEELQVDGFSASVQPGVGDPSVIREFMRQIGIPARVGP